ncbi:MAG: LysE family transporter, partial [Pseudomonadota bacterium]
MFAALLALIGFLFPLAYSPGPGNLFFAANGARFGFGATVPATTGYHLATWAGTLAIGLGLAAVLERFPQVFVVVQYAGGAYVLWLAWTLMRAGSLG